MKKQTELEKYYCAKNERRAWWKQLLTDSIPKYLAITVMGVIVFCFTCICIFVTGSFFAKDIVLEDVRKDMQDNPSMYGLKPTGANGKQYWILEK